MAAKPVNWLDFQLLVKKEIVFFWRIMSISWQEQEPVKGSDLPKIFMDIRPKMPKGIKPKSKLKEK